MRKSIVIAAVALAAIAAQFPFSAARAEAPCGEVTERIRQNVEISLGHIDQEIAETEAKQQEIVETLRNSRWPGRGRFLEDWDNATTPEARERAFRRFNDMNGSVWKSPVHKYMTESGRKIWDKFWYGVEDLEEYERDLQKLRTARTKIQEALDANNNSASDASSQGACVPSDPNSDDPRVALEQQQNQFDLVRVARVALVTAFTPTFLDRRQALLVKLPADMRRNLENGGSGDWAGRSSVTYTSMKIHIEVETAQNEGREIPGALVALNNLYRQMSSYQSAVLETESQIAQVQKQIAHTIVDERAYAMGGGDGGGGGGGEGGNGGGN